MTTRNDLIDGFQLMLRQGLRVGEGYGPDDWSYQIHDEENGWTVKQLFCHLTGTAEVLPGLLGALDQAGEGKNAAEGLDINQFNAQAVAAKQDLSEKELLAAFKTAIEKAMDTIKDMPDEKLQAKRQFGVVKAPVAELIDTFFVLHGIAHVYNTTSRPLN